MGIFKFAVLDKGTEASQKRKMKISSLLATIAAARKKQAGNEQSRDHLSTEIINCGENFFNEEEVRIQSPGWPGSYPDYANCVWNVENECAESFTITPLAFDIEEHMRCRYDRLVIITDGAEDRISYCGGRIGSDYYTSYLYDYSSYDEAVYMLTDNIINKYGMNEPLTIEGNQLQLKFMTDRRYSIGGFDLRITVNTKSSCNDEPHDVTFSAAFDAVEEIIHDAVMALPKWNNVKGLEWSRKRFGWFSDFSDADCANLAGQGVGVGIDYEPARVDAEDPCSTIVSFHAALLGYYDDFVCLDRSDENAFGKKRKNSNGTFAQPIEDALQSLPQEALLQTRN